jgi:hypothetical protein
MSETGDLVALWQDRLATIARNMNELGSAEFTLRARNRLRDGTYTGDTRARTQAAVDQLSAVNDNYLLLAHVVDEAIRANKDGFFVIPEKREARVRELLLGTSVELPLGTVAVNSRDLLGGVQNSQKLTPEQLMATMQAQFGAARDALTAIDMADTQNQADMAALKGDYELLRQRAEAMAWAGDAPVMIDPRQAAGDPLKYAGAIDALKRALGTWASALNAAADRQKATRAAAAAACARLGEVRQLIIQSQAAQTEAQALFGTIPANGDAPMAMLDEWQASVAKACQAGDSRAAEVGLARFASAVEQAFATQSAALAAVQAPVRAYRDLAGQFEALKAKARALGIAAPDEATIRQALALRPVDLPRLTQQVRAFQQQLTANRPSNIPPQTEIRRPA